MTRSVRSLVASVALIGVAMTAVTVSPAPVPASASGPDPIPVLVYEQDFSSDTAGWSNQITHNPGPGTATVAGQALSSYGGLASDLEYRSTWPGHGVVSELDVYLDPEAMAVGNRFRLGVTIANSTGGILRTFNFVVGKVSGDHPALPGEDQVLINATTGSFTFPNTLLNANGGDYTALGEAGWFTFRHSIRVENGALVGELSVVDADGGVVFAATLGNPNDTVGILGGVRNMELLAGGGGSFVIDNQRLFHNEVVLDPGLIEGVVSSGGDPVAGARVRYYAADSSALLGQVFTAADGSYRIDELEGGVYKVRVTAVGYVEQFWSGASRFAKADVVEVPTPAAEHVDFSLQPEVVPSPDMLGTISGIVSGAGAGVAGAQVRAYNSSALVVASTLTGVDGSYALEVVAGEHKLLVVDSSGDWVSPRWVGGTSFSTAATQLVTAGGTTTADTVELVPTTSVHSISGFVVAAGSLAAGLRVVLYNTEAQVVATVFSGPDGSYSFGSLPEGTYFVRVREPGAYADAWWDGGDRWRTATPIVVGPSVTGIYIPVVSLSAPPTEFKAVTAGGSHTCGLTTTGTVQCWGDNDHGQLGDGTTKDRLRPVTVVGLTDVVEVDAGGAHTCARRGDNTVRCWGDNSFGQLGDGTFTSSSTPVAVPLPGNGGTSISAGGGHSCALQGGFSSSCWGKGTSGQLGNGSTTNSPTPVMIENPLGFSIVVVTAGSDHTCWGSAGIASFIGCAGSSASEGPMRMGVGLLASAGGFHTCAVIGGSKSVHCIGTNSSGQLGSGSTLPSSEPVVVAGVSGAAAVTAGGEHSCAVLEDGSARCWGNNGSGRLGDGTTTDRHTPVAVSGGHTWTSLSAGDAHTCGITEAVVRCWGDNTHGQLGDGTTFSRSTP